MAYRCVILELELEFDLAWLIRWQYFFFVNLVDCNLDKLRS
jgi:hypothetical protein